MSTGFGLIQPVTIQRVDESTRIVRGTVFEILIPIVVPAKDPETELLTRRGTEKPV